MGIFDPSFLLGLVILLYLASFVVFALLRIATGISIQRIGYFSLRRIAYTPREGIKITIRGLGLHLHRPSFAQPTWISLRLDELKVTVDIQALAASSSKSQGTSPNAAEKTERGSSSTTSPKPILRRSFHESSRSRTWKRLTGIKESLKKLHEKIQWFRLVDVFARNSSFVVSNLGTFELGTVIMMVDTRRKTVDRGRLFQHKKIPAGDQRPAEWMFTVRGVLFTPEGRASLEILDIATLNIHGLLYKELPGLRDTSISLKLGRVHIPYDDFVSFYLETRKLHHEGSQDSGEANVEDGTFADVIEELDRPGSKQADIMQTVSDSKEFISSILRGIQEIQLAISSVGMTKAIASTRSASDLYLNFSMNEFGVDLHRLDSKSPAHRMYFSPRDIAHQALLAAISLSVSLDDGTQKPERLMYVPMATTTMKTTLPSKTVAFSEDGNTAERNANILYANLVVTSPSIDVDPKHMPTALALIRRRQDRQDEKPTSNVSSHHILSRLLPKASIKFSVHEPVIRVKLPPADSKLKASGDYDLLISLVSSISLDIESSHSAAGDLHYSLTSTLRLSSHQFYYQTALGERHDLLLADSLELKAQVTADPTICVMILGNVQKFSVHMIKPEISAGVRQIAQHTRSRHSANPTKLPPSSPVDPDFLRPLPLWLAQISLQGSNFSIDVAGVDTDVSRDIRGVALQLESWSAEYKQKRSESHERPPSRRHQAKASTATNEPTITITAPDGSHANPPPDSTDGRRLAVHVHGLEGFAIDDMDVIDSASFLSLPRFEVAFSTSSDHEGPIFHLNAYMRSLYIHYSLYRYYAIGIASTVVRDAFALDRRAVEKEGRTEDENTANTFTLPDHKPSQPHKRELVTVDIRSEYIQVKANMPADPPMMLQIFGIECGQHRWAKPFLRSRLLRLYAEAPQLRAFWARILVIKALRFDLREVKKKRGPSTILEQSFDIGSDFIRIGVPHQLVMHKIMDNCVNVMKATQQLQHRFLTGTNEYILKKRPEGPKELPRISIRSKAMLFEIEDGPFDWKLSMIYRIGLIEQKQRLAREEAFRAKVRHIEKCLRQGTSRQRNASNQKEVNGERSQSEDQRGRKKNNSESTIKHFSQSPPRGRRNRMRYDPEGKCSLSEDAKISIDEAERRLRKHNSESWKKRIDGAYQIASRAMRDIRGIFWGSDELPVDDNNERILAMPERPGLMACLISDLHVVLDKPSFPIRECPEYLHKVGKGMPRDMQYALLIPMSVQIDMGEARITLRDYPLPLLHVPAIRAGQSPRLPSWSLKTDFVIAEEYRGDACSKQIPVQIIPPEKFLNTRREKGFAVAVRRTVTPVKTYSDVNVSINTSAPTSITWGTSLQPAIQEMMMVVEGFTKPQVDPSDRVGFWDKIRLNVHSRVRVAWTSGGDVHLNLKGSRDPYVVTGHGAGFVMVWRQNVRWNLHSNDDPKQFMTVDSGEYVLAIPDFSRQARENVVSASVETDSISSTGSFKNKAHFKKTIMKLGGEVRWLAGLVFERGLDDGCRSFEFKPHYDVILKPSEGVDLRKEPDYDAFKGFRSNHIHLSIAVVAPLNRDWRTTNIQPSDYYNSTHLTPKFFTHFFDWWSLFSGAMSLPIRQGKLFPGLEKTSKKFGRHLATIKYNLLLSPLFITHMYKHKDVEEYSEDTVKATGLKLRLDSFMLDLHQRREEFITQGKGRARQIKSSAMRIHEAQLDFMSADLRAISAKIQGTSSEYITRATDDELAELREPAIEADLNKFSIPDQNFDWVDMDDFNELDWILPAENHPETQILPLAFAPRFTYVRQTDHPGSLDAEEGRSSKFGNEPTHDCVMSHENDPRKVQCYLVKGRLQVLDEQIQSHDRKAGEQELKVIRETENQSAHRRIYDELREEGQRLEEKRRFLQQMLNRLGHAIESHTPWAEASEDPDDRHPGGTEWPGPTAGEIIDTELNESSVSDFNNRFIIHNVQLKWNNSLRNIILRYVHQVSQRRGFVYYMTRRAVKFIIDIVEEQNKTKHRRHGKAGSSAAGSSTPASSVPPSDKEGESCVDDRTEELIQDLLNDPKRFVDAEDTNFKADEHHVPESGQPEEDISEDFMALKGYHVRLIAPQIQLQSEKNAKSVLLVTGKSIQLQVIQIMDKDRMADDVSGLVQRRFSVEMDGAQFFVTSVGMLKDHHEIYLGNRYGAPKSDTSWPPWVPFEANLDFHHTPFGWARVVSKTSATLRYDKYNTLRLKYNDEVSGEKGGHSNGPDNPESRIDHLWVEFPHIRAICDSTQYFTMYVIVLDLLLYNEPLEKVRSERLEKIMLASDFSDLRGSPEMVTNLQGRIRQLEEIKTHFQIHKKYLDRQGWLDNQSIEQDLAGCEDELFFMMKAITTSQRKIDDRAETSQSSPYLQWYLSASEIVWHLMRQKEEPLMEIQFNNALYDRTDNSDGSNHNSMEIERMHGLNLLPDAIYPEMLGPYLESGKKAMDGKDPKMLKVSWHSLEAIAGIPVLDQFEVDLFPLKVQLERDIGQKLFEYIFPGVGKKDGSDGGFSPFMLKQTMTSNSDEEKDRANAASERCQVPNVTLNGINGDSQPRTSPSFAMRLRPTTQYPDKEGWTSSVANAKKHSTEHEKEHHFRLFQNSNHAGLSSKLQKHPVKHQPQQSKDSLTIPHRSREGSTTSLSTMGGSNLDKHNRFGLKRTDSEKPNKKDQPSDDLSLMLSRASNYMTLAYVKIPSVVLCLSYKGKGERSIQDVHNFVFRMPVLEYRNKTWSNLDLALRLKKDVIRALISHTGAIIGNKFAHPRPSKTQRNRLHDFAFTPSLLSSSQSINTGGPGSETSSLYGRSTITDPRSSLQSYPRSELSRTSSFASSLREQSLQRPLDRPSSFHELPPEEDSNPLKNLRKSMTRRFTAETAKGKDISGGEEDSEESNRKKSVLLLGKKILGGLNQP